MRKTIFLLFIVAAISLTIFYGYRFFSVKSNSYEEPNYTEKKEEISNEEAVRIGYDLWGKAKSAYWKWGFEYETENDMVKNYYINDNDYSKVLNYSEKTNIFNSDALNIYENYVGVIKKEDGVYLIQADRGADIFYIDSILEIDSIEKDKITFNVISRYKGSEESPELSNMTSKITKFIISNIDGTWKVQEFNMVD
jgi:hypothetical protein